MEKKSLAIVISLAKSHIHYCKALIASIEHYGIENDVIVIKDGDFHITSIQNKKQVTVISTKEINQFHDFNLTGLLTKINICFLSKMGHKYDYYLHMDADSIITSNDFKLKLNDLTGDFYILQGKAINYKDEKLAKLFNNFAYNPSTFENLKFHLNHMWYFSSGHFIMNSYFIEQLKHYLKVYRSELNTGFSKQTRFKFGDQGFFNFVVNLLCFENKLNVVGVNSGIYGKAKEAQHQILTLNTVKDKINTNVDFIHFTGPSRKATLKAHNFGAILYFFNKLFYKNAMFFYFDNRLRIIKYYFQSLKKRVILKLKTIFKSSN
ncbi:hypothetical protein [uncultured Winogradskyella sp.]|uniref:hypothetical protein n=1 Tax=Winogradskyella sp. 4-2091 TaxID=3381659 RepID=UPI00261DC0E0|nr:hypothetical protein [uncultured Winogradskyella sp.]